MLELPNFGHMPYLQYNLIHVMNFVSDAMDGNYDAITYISKHVYFKRA